MKESLSLARTLDYQILRTCERMRLTEREFSELDYDQQLRLLAYAQIRDHEDGLWSHSGNGHSFTR